MTIIIDQSNPRSRPNTIALVKKKETAKRFLARLFEHRGLVVPYLHEEEIHLIIVRRLVHPRSNIELLRVADEIGTIKRHFEMFEVPFSDFQAYSEIHRGLTKGEALLNSFIAYIADLVERDEEAEIRIPISVEEDTIKVVEFMDMNWIPMKKHIK